MLIKGLQAPFTTCGLVYIWVRKHFYRIHAGDKIKLSGLCTKFCKILILFYKLVMARIWIQVITVTNFQRHGDLYVVLMHSAVEL